MLITCFTIILAKIGWILKIRWIVKEWSRSRGPRKNFGFFKVHKNLWFILLTSSTLLYVRLTFLHNQTRWRHVFYTCVVPHHGNCEGWWSDLFNGSHLLVWSLTCFIRVPSVWSHTKDDMLYSRWTFHGLWCRHVFPYVCILHVEYARQGYTPFKRRVSEVGHCPCSSLTHGYSFYSER
jgi:hypothetical protein